MLRRKFQFSVEALKQKNSMIVESIKNGKIVFSRELDRDDPSGCMDQDKGGMDSLIKDAVTRPTITLLVDSKEDRGTLDGRQKIFENFKSVLTPKNILNLQRHNKQQHVAFLGQTLLQAQPSIDASAEHMEVKMLGEAPELKNMRPDQLVMLSNDKELTVYWLDNSVRKSKSLPRELAFNEIGDDFSSLSLEVGSSSRSIKLIKKIESVYGCAPVTKLIQTPKRLSATIEIKGQDGEQEVYIKCIASEYSVRKGTDIIGTIEGTAEVLFKLTDDGWEYVEAETDSEILNDLFLGNQEDLQKKLSELTAYTPVQPAEERKEVKQVESREDKMHEMLKKLIFGNFEKVVKLLPDNQNIKIECAFFVNQGVPLDDLITDLKKEKSLESREDLWKRFKGDLLNKKITRLKETLLKEAKSERVDVDTSALDQFFQYIKTNMPKTLADAEKEQNFPPFEPNTVVDKKLEAPAINTQDIHIRASADLRSTAGTVAGMILGGSGGAYLGGLYGGIYIGAALGTMMFPGIGTLLGTLIGGLVGILVGGAIGAWAGSKAGNAWGSRYESRETQRLLLGGVFSKDGQSADGVSHPRPVKGSDLSVLKGTGGPSPVVDSPAPLAGSTKTPAAEELPTASLTSKKNVEHKRLNRSG